MVGLVVIISSPLHFAEQIVSLQTYSFITKKPQMIQHNPIF